MFFTEKKPKNIFYDKRNKKQTALCDYICHTLLPCFANNFNVLHGDFKELLCDERCHIHLRERETSLFKNDEDEFKTFKVFIFIESKFHLLGPTNQHSCRETQGHSQLVDKRLVVCDVSERKKKSVPSRHRTQHSLNSEEGYKKLLPVPRIYKIFQNKL